VTFARFILCAFCAMFASTAFAEEFPFEVRETTGLRRFGYPIDAKLRLPNPVDDKTKFRIISGKQAVGQVRPVAIEDGKITTVIIDMSVGLAPFEVKKYILEYGPDVVQDEAKSDMKVETLENVYRVTGPGGLKYDVPKDLLGLFHSVQGGKTDYLRPDSTGLVIQYRDNIPFRVGGAGPWGTPTKSHISRSGPNAIGIHFESVEPLRGNREVKSTVDLTFPRSKSWVRVDWVVDDPNGFVSGLGVDLNCQIKDELALIDFGASNTIYTTLKKDQFAFMNWRGPAWKIFQYTTKTDLFAASADSKATPPEGWAHIMDNSRCVAYATTQHLSEHGGEIRTFGDGRFQGWRYFARDGEQPATGPKVFIFWFHFVGMPVQIGALTSPQSMQSSPHVGMSKQK